MEEPKGRVYRDVSVCVDRWLLTHPDEIFFFEDVRSFHDWRERESKQALSKKLHYESHKPNPMLEKRGRGYRLIDKTLTEMRWWETNGKPSPIKLPFELESYVCIYPKSLIVAGAGWGEGKTALAYNVVFLNMEQFDTHLFNSEMISEIVKQRAQDYHNFIPNPPPFKTYYRTDNFADVIIPDGLNVIDYLTVDTDKMYSVRDELKRILNKLTTGIAVVMLQRPSHREIPYGGDPTLWDACLAINLLKDKLKILKVRTPADPKINPQNMTFSFKLSKGINFYDIHTTYE